VDATGFQGPCKGRGAREAVTAFGEEDPIVGRISGWARAKALSLPPAMKVSAPAHDAARNDYRFSSIVLGIVNSKPFQMRTAAANKGD